MCARACIYVYVYVCVCVVVVVVVVVVGHMELPCRSVARRWIVSVENAAASCHAFARVRTPSSAASPEDEPDSSLK